MTDQSKQYYLDNKDKILKRVKQYQLDNKEKIAKRKKQWQLDNKEKIAKQRKQYRLNNKEKIEEEKRQYYLDNKEKIADKNKRYRLDNKDKIAEQKNQWYINNKGKVLENVKSFQKARRKIDPVYKLRTYISTQIWFALKRNNGSKRGESILKHLPYTFEELKEYLEKQFEPWMNWDNHGRIDSNNKTWQIDHIIPQSLLPFDSYDHPNFLKCWALSNLQPLEALENIKKGNKVYHDRK